MLALPVASTFAEAPSVKAKTALLLGLVLLATAAIAIETQLSPDPLALFRGPDGRLSIPGGALTPQLQRLLFQGNDLRPYYDLTFMVPERSSHPTARLVPFSFQTPNLNVYIHDRRDLGASRDLSSRLREWFPPVDWHEVGAELLGSVRSGIGWFFDLFTVNARADTLAVDSTTTTVVDPDAATCTTSQTAAAGDNAVLVMLSNRPATAYTTVTYGSVNLNLIGGTASSGTGVVRTEMWFYQGAIPGGAQTMTATLVSGTSKQVCATILLSGVSSSSPTAGGTTASGNGANPSIAISPGGAELAFAVFAHQTATAPSAVAGTGATATDLYGVGMNQCSASGTNICGAGSSMPNPGTAITWTIGGGNSWVLAAVRVAPSPNCSVAAGDCYRIGAGGAWNAGANWSNSPGGAACGCTPIASNNVFFNATPTGTTSLAAATTITSIDMTGFTGTLDTTASNWPLTINGLFNVQGTFNARSSTVTVTGNVNVLTATSAINLGVSTWTVAGTWTNASTSAGWIPGTGTVTFTSATGGTMTFAGANLAGSEFNNITFSSSAGTPQTFTMATRGLRWAGTLNISEVTSTTTLVTANLGLTGGALNVGNGGILTANASAITVTGVTMTGGTSGTITLTTGSLSDSGNWDTSGAGSVFTKGTSTVTMSGASNLAILNAANNFNNLTISAAGTVTQTGLVDVSGTLAVNAGAILASGTFALTIAALAANMAGGISGGAAGAKTINGNLSIAAAGFFAFGGATWTFNGSWTNSSTSGSWSAGAGTVVFNSAISRVMTFGNLGVAEFNNVQFSPTAAATFTMAANGLRWAATLTLNNNATLSTANLGLTGTGGNLTVNNGATLTAGTSTVNVGNVTMTGGVSGVITTSGSWTVTGNWDTSGAGSALTGTSSTVTMSGPAQTVRILNAANGFGALTISGTITAASAITTAGLVTVSGTFDTTATNYTLNAVALNVNTGGALTANASTITVTSMDTHLGTFTVGTSSVVVNASGGTINISQTVNNLTVNPGVATTFSGSLIWSGTLTLTSAGPVAFGSNSLSSSGPATMTFASATITMSTGSWNTASTATFTATSSTVTFSGTGNLTIAAGASFGTLTMSGGTRTLMSQLTAGGLLTLSGGTLAKGTNGLTANAGLTMSGGALTSTSGAVAIAGNVTISSAASYIAFGSESWTVSGSWTNSSTSASWSIGTATVTFTSSSAQTMTFAALPASAAEFNNVTFNSGASTVTFTMAARALSWAGTLTVQGGSGTTTLATSNFSLTGGAPAIGNAALLVANASTTTVSNVTMNGGTSGTLTLTTGAWTVSGNWNTSGAGSSVNSGTSTVTFTGASTTLALAAGQRFYNLTIGGTASITSTVTAAGTLTLNNAAVLTKTGQSIAFNGLTENGSGSLSDGAISVVNFSVTNSDPTNITTITGFTVWTVGARYTWTHSSSVPTSTLTFTIGGNTVGDRFNVTKDAVAFTNGFVSGTGQVVFSMLGSDPVVDVVVSGPCGGSRYWVGGTGSWSQTVHWSASSGGTNGCSVPNGGSSVFFDLNSGGGIVTVDANAALASLDTTGWTGTISIGTFNFAVGGSVTHASGVLTIGASSGLGLTATGRLTLSGSAVFDGSGAASLVTVLGDATISSPTAYVKMGSGTWTISGSWTNASTSANWSAGTGTVVFVSVSSQTMTFAALAGNEFYNVTFQSAAASGSITFTMATNGLRWGGVLTIQDAAGSTTALATTNLALTGGSLLLGNSGILTANASTVSVVDVTMIAGGSGVVTVTSGTWTVSGNWDTSGVGSTFAKGSSTIALSGATKTVRTRDASNGFNNLTISGSVTAASATDVSGTLSIRGTFITAGNNLTGGANLVIGGGGSLVGTTASLTLAGVTMNDGSANSLSLTTGSITLTGSWDTSGASSIFDGGTSTVTFTGASRTLSLGPGQRFYNLTIAGTVALGSGLTAGSLTVSSSAVLTKTNYGIAFNRLSVNGTLVDGSVTISSLSVTNSNGTALVTISAFTE